MELSAIAVVDKNWGIGRDGGLLIHLPGDLKYFKEKTLDNIVIMGRATLESLPGGRPLPGRTTIIMTSNKKLQGDFYTVSSVDELFELIDKLTSETPDMIPYVSGGASVYEQLMPYTNTCLITKIDNTFDAQKFFPNLDEDDEFQMTSEGDTNSENGVDYKFTEYKRVKK